MWLGLRTHRLVELQHLKCKVIWFELPLPLTIQVSVWLLVFSILAWSQPQATSQTRQSVGTPDPAIRSDYLGRTKCLCWWRACSKIWECRNQCGSSGPWRIDHDSLPHWQPMPCLGMRVNRAKWASSECFLYHLPRDPCLSPPLPLPPYWHCSCHDL